MSVHPGSVPALDHFARRRILLLQGPMGPFFRRFAQDLRSHGAEVFKINFNGGDWLFYPRADRNFRGTLQDWPDYFRRAVAEWRIDTVILYADCRPVHEKAIKICRALGVDFYTFEEGYLRGDHITFEHGRTNAYSSLPRSALVYLNFGPSLTVPPERAVGYTFYHQMLWAGLYHFAAWLLGQLIPVLPPHTYHRGIGWREVWPQIRSFLRKGRYKITEAGIQRRLVRRHSRRFFLVPLQVALDSQVTRHSPYGEGGVPAFIAEVVESFARHAPDDTLLVFKHHPLDRGYNDYRRLLRRLARQHGLGKRVLYIHDQRLPPLLDHAQGVVVINSTVGISALLHGCPVKVMGRAFYDMKGLTAQVDLDTFWRHAREHAPNMHLVNCFRNVVVHQTQVNGSYYRRLPTAFSSCGLQWPATKPRHRPAGSLRHVEQGRH